MDGHLSWSVYIVACADGSFYVGVSNDVAARVAAHNAGKGARYTRARRPVRCVFRFDTETGEEARRLEGLMKRLDRRRRERVVDGDVDVIAGLWAEVQRRVASKARGPGARTAP